MAIKPKLHAVDIPTQMATHAPSYLISVRRDECPCSMFTSMERSGFILQTLSPLYGQQRVYTKYEPMGQDYNQYTHETRTLSSGITQYRTWDPGGTPEAPPMAAASALKMFCTSAMARSAASLLPAEIAIVRFVRS